MKTLDGTLYRRALALQFLCLCVRSRVLVGIFGTLSLHPKIPFPAAGFGREVRAQLQPCSGLCTAVIRDLGPALQLFRIESEHLKLSAPFSRWIAEPLDADAAGQATFYGRFDKIGCEEGERDSSWPSLSRRSIFSIPEA